MELGLGFQFKSVNLNMSIQVGSADYLLQDPKLRRYLPPDEQFVPKGEFSVCAAIYQNLTVNADRTVLACAYDG